MLSFSFEFLGGSAGRIYTDPLAGFADALELHDAVREREQGVITADADVRSRTELRSALTDEDIAGKDHLTAEPLHAEALGVAIAAVFSTSGTFFMSHTNLFRMMLSDARDLDLGVLLPMAVADAIPFPLLLLQNNDCVVFHVAQNLRLHTGTADVRGADLGRRAVVQDEHFLEFHCAAGFGIEERNREFLGRCDAHLTSGDIYHCVHDFSLKKGVSIL